MAHFGSAYSVPFQNEYLLEKERMIYLKKKKYTGINYHMIRDKTYNLKMTVFGELKSKKLRKWVNDVMTMK